MARRLRHRQAREVDDAGLAGRSAVFDRFSAAVALPMLILTVVMVPLLIIPFTVHLSPSTRGTLEAIDYFIWAVFLFEYLIRLSLAPRRWHFVIRNVPDLVVVAVPMLRPLRIVRSVRALRLLRLSRLSAVAGEGTVKARKSLHARATSYVLIVMGFLILITSVVVLDLERGTKTANIKTFGDAVWWAMSTITTVGYGDRFPVTGGGRAVAVVLMIGGIALLGIITAAIAAFFVEQNRDRGRSTPAETELLRRLEAIEELLGRLTVNQLAVSPPRGSGSPGDRSEP